MTGFLTKIVLPIAAMGLLAFAVIHVIKGQKPESQLPPLITPTHSPFSTTVAGAGLIEATTENIAVGTPAPGIVVEVFVKVEDHVKVGAPLFRLDDRMLRADLAVRRAAVASAQSDLDRLEHMPRPESLQMMQAQLDEAKANLLDQKDQYERSRVLNERHASTDQELKIREQAFHVAKAKFDRAQTEYSMTKAGTWTYEIEVARAALTQAQSQQRQVETELDRLVVRSLVDGQVLQVEVRPGEYVATPSNKALVLIGDIDQLHVRVDIDERDIPRFTPGAPARAMLRGHAGFEFPLRFVRVEPYVIPKKSLTGDNTERVDTRVLPVIYAFDRPALQAFGQRLYVGQQVDVYIDATGSAKPSTVAEKQTPSLTEK